MKNKLAKTLLSFAMAGVISCMSLVASANSVVEEGFSSNVLSNSDNGNISTIAISPPTNLTSLPYKAVPAAIYAGHTCYTKYCFQTSTGTLKLDYHLYALLPQTGERDVKFSVLKGTPRKLLGGYTWETVKTQQISFNDKDDEYEYDTEPITCDGTVTFTDLDKSGVYCILIENVTKETSGNKNAVAGTIDISK